MTLPKPMSMVTAIACTVAIATASKTKDRKTSRLHHEVWRKHRGLVEEDHVATIVSETAGETSTSGPTSSVVVLGCMASMQH